MFNVPPYTGFPELDEDDVDGDDDELHAARPAAASTAALSAAKRFDALVTGMFLRLEVEPSDYLADRLSARRSAGYSDSAVNPLLRCPRASVSRPDCADP